MIDHDTATKITLFNNIRAHVDIFREMRTNDQSDHDSRIWYHCWPASKRILQSSPPYFLPKAMLDSLRLLISFSFFFLFVFPWLASLEDFLLRPFKPRTTSEPVRNLRCHFSQYLKSL